MEKATEVTVKGIVIASRWGKDGIVTSVDIAGYDEQRYRVAEDLMGMRLRLFTKKTVIVDGTVNITDRGKTICVHRFQVATPVPVQPKVEGD